MRSGGIPSPRWISLRVGSTACTPASLDKEPRWTLPFVCRQLCRAWDSYKMTIEQASQRLPTPPDSRAAESRFRMLRENHDRGRSAETNRRNPRKGGSTRNRLPGAGDTPGAGGASGSQADSLRGWEELAQRLDHAGFPLDTKAQLEAFLKQAAQKAAQSKDRSLNTRSADSIYADLAPIVTQLWRKKQQHGIR